MSEYLASDSQNTTLSGFPVFSLFPEFVEESENSTLEFESEEFI